MTDESSFSSAILDTNMKWNTDEWNETYLVVIKFGRLCGTYGGKDAIRAISAQLV
jgi:hypothetical protein